MFKCEKQSCTYSFQVPKKTYHKIYTYLPPSPMKNSKIRHWLTWTFDAFLLYLLL